MKYTREVLEVPVRESKSVSEVMRRLGVKWNGGTQGHITKRIKLAGLDTSHFLGQARNRGTEHKGGNERLTWEQVLVKERSPVGKKESAALLRRAMLESGIVHKCEICECLPIWLGHPLTLEIDHINGDNLDNQRHNVRFLCPNCHTQTRNFGSKNIGRLSDRDVDELNMWSGNGNLEYLDEGLEANAVP